MPNLDRWHTKYDHANVAGITSALPITIGGLASGNAATSSGLFFDFREDAAGEQATFASYAVFMLRWKLAGTGLAGSPKIHLSILRGIPDFEQATLALAFASATFEDFATLVRTPDITIDLIPNDTAVHQYVSEPILLPPGPFAIRVDNLTGQPFVSGSANSTVRLWQTNRVALQRGWLEG